MLQRKRSKLKNHQVVKEEVMNEIIPSKSGIHKRTKKPVKNPIDSPIKQPLQEPKIESVELMHVDSSNTISSQKGIKKIRKPQFHRKGVLFREVSFLVSPASKKHQELDMDHKLQKKKCKNLVPINNVTVKTSHGSVVEGQIFP
ncbi:unnamed protein product [Lactuca saligna]|uniref:Uncharacterized protein n=1 Tax=Lactuca saligna TaxID=75948 RepID=A0AA35ZE83_LACSI|nr:unnamed protein product [Lactuca saligna]